LPTYGNPPQPLYELCRDCDHFIEANASLDEDIERYDLAPFIHLDNGNKDHDHDAAPSGSELAGADLTETWTPGVAMFLSDWRAQRPDLFVGHADGQIGPNSRFHRPLVRA
jgi:hypothetical protein